METFQLNRVLSYLIMLIRHRTLPISLFLVPLALGQTVYLAGDSTMAPNGDGAGTNTDGCNVHSSRENGH